MIYAKLNIESMHLNASLVCLFRKEGLLLKYDPYLLLFLLVVTKHGGLGKLEVI